jgi:NADH:ubiquinone oxidoreductase subunit 6 (subunit J)/NADH:ubiquinone oxidoreductase subunit 3 (subunit A)
MELLFSISTLKGLLPILAIIAGIFVISTKNAIISVFNLIVLYILVAFYLIYIGITYLGISYIIIYIGAIAILFLFIIMMIDIEVVEKRSNNYLPLLFLLLGGFFFMLKKVIYNIGLIKMKSITFKEELILVDNRYRNLFDINSLNNFNGGDKNKGINDHCINMNKDKEIKENALFLEYKHNTFVINYNNNYNIKKNIFIDNLIPYFTNPVEVGTNFLLVTPNWGFAVNRITQITAVGDVLYSVYHSYIYILSVILLLGMVGAIILTADNYQEIKIINISKTKKSNIFALCFIIIPWKSYILNYINIQYKNIKFYFYNLINILILHIKSYSFHFFKEINNIYQFIYNNIIKKINYFDLYFNKKVKKNIAIPSFFHTLSSDYLHSEDIMGNLMYFIIANLIVAILLLGINSYFSLSVKYLEKGGGFECGFTSFVQTRERFNVIFYRVSLLFLVFDLEIILAFPYTAIYQKNQNISKNNVLAFLYILIVGFIYELKEGALNIVKKAHSSEINNK